MNNINNEIKIHFEMRTNQINQKLANCDIRDRIEIVYHNDDNIDLNKIAPNGIRQYILISSSALKLNTFLDGINTVFLFQ